MGIEKFLEPCPLVCLANSSVSLTFDNLLVGRLVDGGGILFLFAVPPLSILAPLPPLVGAGLMTLVGGSTLDARLWPLPTLFGSAGTGGASADAATGALTELLGERPGDGDRNVRSVMLPPLFVLCRPARPAPPRVPLPITLLLSTEVCEFLLIMRLVCRLPTGSGEVACVRKAAAAAEDESDVFDWAE